MKCFLRRVMPAVVAAVIGLGSLSASVPARAQSATALKIALIPIEPAAGAYYAKENGFFTKAGLDVDIDQNPSTPALASAVLSGTYDIAYGTVPTLATAHSKGLPFVLIAPGIADSPQHFGGAIVIGTNATFKTGKDLNGKTLGTAGLNTIAEYLPRAWIDKNGGDSSTVKFIEMPFPITPDVRLGRLRLVEPHAEQAKRVVVEGDFGRCGRAACFVEHAGTLHEFRAISCPGCKG